MYKDGWSRLFTNFSEIKNPRQSNIVLSPLHKNMVNERIQNLQPYQPHSAPIHPNCGQWSVPFFFLLFRCLTVCVFEKHKLQPYHPYSASAHPNCGQWSQRRSRGLIIEKLLFASSTAFLTFLLLIFHPIHAMCVWFV